MTWSEELQIIGAELMASPKTTGVAAGATAALGAVGLMEVVHTTLSLLAIGAAVICTLALARYHRANERHMALKNKLLLLELQEKEAATHKGALDGQG